MATISVLGVPCVYDLTAPTSSNSVLVFVHGWLLSRSYWRPVIEALSPTYQCLSYDLRGFGESPAYPTWADESSESSQVNNHPLTAHDLVKNHGTSSTTIVPADAAQLAPASATERSHDRFLNDQLPAQPNHHQPEPQFQQASYTPAAYAKDLAVLLQQLKLDQVWLVGHSLGGTIALWAANQLPNLVRGVICLNAGGGIYLKEDFDRFRAAGQQLLKLRPRWLCHLPLIDLLFTRSTVARPISRDWGKQRLIDFVAAHPEAALGSLLDSTTEAEVHCLPQVVARLTQPVYFMAGSQDPVMEPRYVKHLASFHSLFGTCGDNVIEIPDCGHMVMLEQPSLVTLEIHKILQQFGH